MRVSEASFLQTLRPTFIAWVGLEQDIFGRINVERVTDDVRNTILRKVLLNLLFHFLSLLTYLNRWIYTHLLLDNLLVKDVLGDWLDEQI